MTDAIDFAAPTDSDTVTTDDLLAEGGLAEALSGAIDSLAPPVWVSELLHKVDVLTEAVNVIGQQQQWVTNRIAELYGQFAGVMQSSGGNAVKMMLGLLGRGRGNVVEGQVSASGE